MRLQSGSHDDLPFLISHVMWRTLLISSLAFAFCFFSRVADCQQQESLELKYRIEEEQDVGTFVGNVVRDANLDKIYDPAALRQLQFRFLRQSDMFTIDNGKGVIYTNSRIDREAVCPGVDNCDKRLDVVVQTSPHPRFIRVVVTILDVNDNRPRFDADERTVEVSEMTAVGSVVYVPFANDPDGPGNSVQRYLLLSDSDRFELTGNERRNDGNIDAKLILVKSLDRELVDAYNLQILAVDGGYPQNTGSIDVVVRVLDVNDNSPEFDNAGYNVTIPENVPAKTTILQVHATDADIGLNGDVSYSFSLSSMAAFGHLFGINNKTGDIFLLRELDHEESASYHLKVVAQDRGLDSVAVGVPVNIHVKDVNDNPPELIIDTLSALPGVAEVAENGDAGTFVARVTVVDRDSGDNGRFVCQLNDSRFEMTSAYDAEYQIVTTTALDREEKSIYDVTITCTDFGSEPRVSVSFLKVIVTDVNDNDPVFGQSNYRGELIENNYVGANLFQVNATDRDTGDNSHVVYRIAGDAANWFHVEPDTGLVKASISFDRENAEHIRFSVIAEDRGVPLRSSFVAAHVVILDINDERPVFSHPGYSFAIQENQPLGTEVGAVVAHDADSTIYGEVMYAIVPSHGSELFEIDQKTGAISSTKELDRETQSVYYLHVAASDRGVPPLSGTASVTIYVSDENDNAPVFDYPTATNDTIYVSNQTPKGHVVTCLRARDDDVGKNAKITYEMTDETKMEMFHLDLELGTVLVGGDLANMDGRRYTLEFVAKDDGDPPKMAVARLNIIISKSIAFLFAGGDGSVSDSAIAGQNFVIVVLLAAVSLVVIVVLVVAIVMICRQDRNKETHKYNCRAETLKMLTKGVKPSASSDCCSDVAQHGSLADDRARKELGFAMDYRDYDETKEISSLDPCYFTDSSKHQTEQTPAPTSGSSLSVVLPPTRTTVAYGTLPSNSPASNEQQMMRNNSCHGSKITLPPQQHCREHEQVDRLLKALQQDGDADSVHSGDGSNTDSGHGPSEEGEGAHNHRSAAAVNQANNAQVGRLAMMTAVCPATVENPNNNSVQTTSYVTPNDSSASYTSSRSHSGQMPPLQMSTFSPTFPRHPSSSSCSTIFNGFGTPNSSCVRVGIGSDNRNRLPGSNASFVPSCGATSSPAKSASFSWSPSHQGATNHPDVSGCINNQIIRSNLGDMNFDGVNNGFVGCKANDDDLKFHGEEGGDVRSAQKLPSNVGNVIPMSKNFDNSRRLDSESSSFYPTIPSRMPFISETSESLAARLDDNDDDAMATSGSCIIDADNLCDEIDQLFYKDVVGSTSGFRS